MYCVLQAASGRYVRVDQEHGLLLRADLADAAGADVFELAKVEASVVTLRSIAVGRYVCAEEGGGRELVANRTAAGAWESFEASFPAEGEGDSRVLVLRAHAGSYVSAAGEVLAAVASTAGRDETFTLHPVDSLFEAMGKMEDCCGTVHAPHDGRLMWDDETHRWVLASALAVLEHHREWLPEAENVLELWRVQQFDTGVTDGLYDADYKPEYKGFAGETFSSHFCDPDTGKNFLNFQGATALTEVQRFSASAAQLAASLLIDRRAGRRVDGQRYYDAGYQLGLALHYFTDLTQPMHAANFANIMPTLRLDDRRHSGFETYVETVKKGTDPASKARIAEWTLKPSEVSAADFSGVLRFATPVDAARAAAVYAKGVFKSHVRKLMDDHTRLVPDGHGKLRRVIDNEFGNECDPALELALPAGQKHTAAYLVTWSRTLFLFDVTAYLPVNMQAGNRGIWTLSSNGNDGSWMRGNHHGASAQVARCEAAGFRFDGSFRMLFGSQGYLGIEADSFAADGHCRLRLAPSGSESWQEYRAAYTLRPGDRTIEYRAPGLFVRQTSFTAHNWYPGVQFRVELNGQTAHICFEDSSL